MFYDVDWYDRCYYDFRIPIIAIVTEHSKQKAKINLDTVKEEVKLEELKNQNYLLETEKMKLQLEQMSLEDAKQDPFIIK